MGAYAIIGIGVPHHALIRVETLRGCAHDVPKSQKFCGTCGAKRETTKTVPVDGGEESCMFYDRNIHGRESPKPHDIVVIAAVSIYADDTVSEEPLDPSAVEKGRTELKALFKKAGIEEYWKDSNFGIWAAASY